MIKTRTFPESNYHAVYLNGKTMRFPLDPTKPVTALTFPEFYDIKITNKCYGGCPYCYQDSVKNAPHYEDLVGKTDSFFGTMSENERPFQVAIGGGEPTIHPEFGDLCHRLFELGIDPNYTTAGTSLTPKVMDITTRFVTGVAVSCHDHLNWRKGVEKLLEAGVYTNLHVVISDAASVQRLDKIYREFHGRINYFVLLPQIAQGRAKIEFNSWFKLKHYINALTDRSDIAFGAMFYPYLHDLNWDISLYEPEAFSRYLDMDKMEQFASSFSVEPLVFNPE